MSVGDPDDTFFDDLAMLAVAVASLIGLLTFFCS
jgi:hypothetical protein